MKAIVISEKQWKVLAELFCRRFCGQLDGQLIDPMLDGTISKRSVYDYFKQFLKEVEDNVE